MDSLIEDIKKYEALAKVIEPGAGERKVLLEKVNAYTEGFLEKINDRPAFIHNEEMGRGLYDSPISEAPLDIDSIIKLFRENVEEQGLSPVSGKFMGYIAPCSMYYSALGDYIAAITDEYSSAFANCPGAVRMENMLINWMAGLVGYPDTARGNLASGGSIATQTCMVTAREAHQLKSADYPKAVIYLSEHTHHCVDKALHIIGMGESIIRHVPLDDAYKIDDEKLPAIIQRDIEQGLKPWMIVASTGTTNLGTVDRLDAIADICSEYGLWYHVDGAYGGFFILSELVAEKFKGVEKSDSIVMNPHKALYTPFGMGATLVRNGELLLKSHQFSAAYLQDTESYQDEISPANLGPELTRHFRAVRLWLPLKLIGVAPFRAALSEKLLLARYAYEQMEKLDGFEMGPYPELSIFVFRYIPPEGDVDQFNKNLIESLRVDGRIFLSSSTIDGKYMIRVSILSYRTHVDTIDYAINVIQENISKLLTT